MELTTIEELLIAILPAGTATIVVTALAFVIRGFLNKIVDKLLEHTNKLEKMNEKLEAMNKKQEELMQENIRLKKNLNIAMSKQNNVKVEGEQDGEEESI